MLPVVLPENRSIQMAALRKKLDSKFWFACFTLPDGRRVQRSTKETARKLAQAKADEWEKLSQERAKAKQAHKVIADIYKAAHKAELPDATARSYLDGWLKRRKKEVSVSSYRSYEARAKHFLSWLAEGAERPLTEIETRHIVAYRDALADRLSASTSNLAIKVLRLMFEDARREGFLADNPAKDCPRLKAEVVEQRRPFTMDELRDILASCDAEWRSMILFGLYTGQRIADLARLTWANLDLIADEVQVRTAKTNRIVRIPICAPLKKHIAGLTASDDPKTPLHPRACQLIERGSGPMLSRQFGDLLASVGLISSRKHSGKGEGRSARRAASELSFHSLRHTATSIMKNAGISPAIVQDIIGHESAEISAQYTHIDSTAKRQALDSMPDLGS